MDAKIYAVDEVSFFLTKSNPPQLIIEAEGRVPTSGWTNASLSPFVYINPPADGIWDFSFLATAPVGPALQRISKISVQTMVGPMPEWCRGVRIHSSTNTIESTGEPTSVGPDSMVEFSVANNWVPFPWAKRQDVSPMSDPGDAWPWKLPDYDWSTARASTLGINVEDAFADAKKPTLISELHGRALRVIRPGDRVTLDLRPDRCNVQMSRENRIERIWFG